MDLTALEFRSRASFHDELPCGRFRLDQIGRAETFGLPLHEGHTPPDKPTPQQAWDERKSTVALKVG